MCTGNHGESAEKVGREFQSSGGKLIGYDWLKAGAEKKGCERQKINLDFNQKARPVSETNGAVKGQVPSRLNRALEW
jgi:hypothetical protein